eukprot:Skav220945  [mRNA]  locus=scaffold2381:86212:86631:+ [translate_table: standard]
MEALVAIVFGAFSLPVVPWCHDQVPGFAVEVAHLDYLQAGGLKTLIRLCCDGGSAWPTDLADLEELVVLIYLLWCPLVGLGLARAVAGQDLLDAKAGEVEIDAFFGFGPPLGRRLITPFPVLMRLDHGCHRHCPAALDD